MLKMSGYFFLFLVGLFVVFITADEDEKPPNLTKLPPNLSFSCDGKKPGFYADQQIECQVYHICSPNNEHSTFLCGPGTIFHQKNLVCDLPTNYDCADASKDADEGNAHAFESKSSPSPA
uniref:SLPTX1 n=1 Tax=Scolopendra viridis TaxID=118503 RepID=A0A4D5RA58_SCOVI